MKYFDTDKLIAEIKVLQCEQGFETGEEERGYQSAIKDILNIITSLQQEQPEVQSGKFVFPKYLYARTKDNKTIDMSYVPQDMTAIEYIRNNSIEQEQSEVDLEKEIQECWQNWVSPSNQNSVEGVLPKAEFASYARHFYKLRLNTGKEDTK